MQQPQNITQSKTSWKISPQKRSIFLGRSEQHDKVIPVPNYMEPKTMSEHDSISKTITRKGMQNIRRENPAYTDPFIGPPPKPTVILHR